MDKRIEKTMDKLSRALLNLCCRKDLKNITVIELCAEAHINKSTFYLHFKSMDECLEAIPSFVARRILEVENNEKLSEESKNRIIENLLDFIEENRDICTQFYNSEHYASATFILKKSIVAEISKRRHFSKTENHALYVAIYAIVATVLDTFFYCAQFNDREKEKQHLQNAFNCFVPLADFFE